MDNKNILDKFALKFAKIIKKYTKYIIVSGFVAISSGRTRATEDIDMIIKPVNKEGFLKIHDELTKENFICVQSDNPKEIYDNYLSSFISARYIEKKRPLPQLELKFAKDELDEYQLKTRTNQGLSAFFYRFKSKVLYITYS